MTMSSSMIVTVGSSRTRSFNRFFRSGASRKLVIYIPGYAASTERGKTIKKLGRIDCQSTRRIFLTVTVKESAPIRTVSWSPNEAPMSRANSSSTETQGSTASCRHHSPAISSLPAGWTSDQVKLASRWRGAVSDSASSQRGNAAPFTSIMRPRVMG